LHQVGDLFELNVKLRYQKVKGRLYQYPLLRRFSLFKLAVVT